MHCLERNVYQTRILVNTVVSINNPQSQILCPEKTPDLKPRQTPQSSSPQSPMPPLFLPVKDPFSFPRQENIETSVQDPLKLSKAQVTLNGASLGLLSVDTIASPTGVSMIPFVPQYAGSQPPATVAVMVLCGFALLIITMGPLQGDSLVVLAVLWIWYVLGRSKGLGGDGC